MKTIVKIFIGLGVLAGVAVIGCILFIYLAVPFIGRSPSGKVCDIKDSTFDEILGARANGSTSG